MRRTAALVLLLAAGCSTAPIAGFLDLVKPGHVESPGPYYGGVNGPPPNGTPLTAPAVPAAGGGLQPGP